jgi:hypothetical protein
MEATPSEFALEFTPDPELDTDDRSYVAQWESFDWKPKPRDAWEREHRELMERISIQPENPPEETPFVVGQHQDDYGYLEALPGPRWPSPGQRKTSEIESAYNKARDEYRDANHSLQKCVRLLASKTREPDAWHDRFSGPPSQIYAETWGWLTGLWQGRKIEPPSEMQMMAWARKYNEKHYTRKTRMADEQSA